jgi:hypothetical protein
MAPLSTCKGKEMAVPKKKKKLRLTGKLVEGPSFIQIMFFLTLGVSICLDVVSIETLDLDAKKGSVSTVEKISTVSKS